MPIDHAALATVRKNRPKSATLGLSPAEKVTFLREWAQEWKEKDYSGHFPGALDLPQRCMDDPFEPELEPFGLEYTYSPSQADVLHPDGLGFKCGPIAAITAEAVLGLMDKIDERIADDVDLYFTNISDFTQSLEERATNAARARHQPIHSGLGAGWAFTLPVLEFPGVTTGREGFVYFDGYRARPITGNTSAVFATEDAVLWALNAPIDETPCDTVVTTRTSGFVRQQCVIDAFGAEHPYTAGGPVIIRDNERDDLHYRLSVRDRLHYFDEFGRLRVITDFTHNNTIEFEWANVPTSNFDALSSGELATITDSAGNVYSFAYVDVATMDSWISDAGEDPMTIANRPPLIASISSAEKVVSFTYSYKVEADAWALSLVAADEFAGDGHLEQSYRYEEIEYFMCVEQGCGFPNLVPDNPDPPWASLSRVRLTGVDGPYDEQSTTIEYHDQELEPEAGEFGQALMVFADDTSLTPWEYYAPDSEGDSADALYKYRAPDRVSRIRVHERSNPTGQLLGVHYENNFPGRGVAPPPELILREKYSPISDDHPPWRDWVFEPMIMAGEDQWFLSEKRTYVGSYLTQDYGPFIRDVYEYGPKGLVDTVRHEPHEGDGYLETTYTYPEFSDSDLRLLYEMPIGVIERLATGQTTNQVSFEYRESYPWVAKRISSRQPSWRFVFADDGISTPLGHPNELDPGGSQRPVAVIEIDPVTSSEYPRYQSYDSRPPDLPPVTS